jgi:hypothetical protein
MKMQEECRLEMMKFYIQSQNPTLFEEIYHDVSYPSQMGNSMQQQQNYQQQDQQQHYPSSDDQNQSKVNSITSINDLKDLIINSLNSNANDFIPKKYKS